MIKYLTPVILLAILVVSWYGVTNLPESVVGSVRSTDEYTATTTGEFLSLTGTNNVTTLKFGRGSVGSIVITGTTTGEIFLFDATTTDNSLRASVATSSLFLVSVPVSTVVGTYQYDVEFNTGLVFVIKGIQPTTTITYR